MCPQCGRISSAPKAMGQGESRQRELGSFGQRKRLGREGNGLEEEEGEDHGPMVVTGKSGSGLGPSVVSARGDAF
jgi:hypothetical protein